MAEWLRRLGASVLLGVAVLAGDSQMSWWHRFTVGFLLTAAVFLLR